VPGDESVDNTVRKVLEYLVDEIVKYSRKYFRNNIRLADTNAFALIEEMWNNSNIKEFENMRDFAQILYKLINYKKEQYI
jgi:fructose-1,6-bisphosphatase